jgi:RsiW-degrading membrane proteinase PrsW (M82 family)
MNLYIIIVALLPVAILLYYIYRKDKNDLEPTGQLVKAFMFGVLSAPLSFCMSIPFGWMEFYPAESTTLFDSVSTAFFGAAIPEEVAKLFMLWLLLRKNPHFDEKMDGIVYAVCVSLGFAALENIMYLFANYESYLSVGISRAIFSIPGHFCFGILMGYYYSLAKFYPIEQKKNKTLALVAPVLAHGLYDSVLFVMDVAPEISFILMAIFLVLCHRMWKFCHKKMNEHLERDLENE